jgi:alginate O-acetyltransferase complex protein AlgJ
MKKLSLKLIFFAIPIFSLISLDYFLPLDSFTYRVWEAVVVVQHNLFLSGPFYPLTKIKKVELGDLAPHSKFAVPKEVEWETDAYGYRKSSRSGQTYDIVIIGDSNIAGSSLTQEDILSEVLEKRLHVGVYPLAPVGIDTFLADPRFKIHPPKLVIVACVERNIFSLPKPHDFDHSNKGWRLLQNQSVQMAQQTIKAHPSLMQTFILVDRLFYKRAFFRYLKARISKLVYPVDPYADVPMRFLQGEAANQDVSSETLEDALRTIELYKKTIEKRGIAFIFLPIPNKENIYYDYLKNSTKPSFLKKLILALKEKGIAVADTQTAFDEAKIKQKELLFHRDDSHWNKWGVLTTADLLVPMIPVKSKG